MSYSEFTNPGAGYRQFAYPAGGYRPSLIPKGLARNFGREGTFLDLSPYKDFAKTPEGGVGPYHVNHFAGYFKLDGPTKSKVTIADFFTNFAQIFSLDNVATATKAKYAFEKHRTIQFVLKSPFPDIHEDWVTLQQVAGTNSFFARTLMKGWTDAEDVQVIIQLYAWYKIAQGASPLPLPEPNVRELLLINQRHFLAGRRSWSIEYSPESNLYYIETVTLERYSHDVYMALEGVMGMRKSIVEIWTSQIANFASHYGLTLESQSMTDYYPGAQYTRHENRNIYYITDQKKTAAEARNIPWFSKVLKRHPGLLTP